MKVALHTCCGPCASACVPVVREAVTNEVVLYFANSNIDTREEYEKRLAEARKLAEAEGVQLVAEPYNHAEWLEEVAKGFEDEPEKGRRCARCFRYNLQKVADYVEREGLAGFATSLTVSPHKPSPLIFDVGESVSPKFLKFDFKKKGGFLKSVQRAKELGLYRQSYCGCEFSKRNVP